MIAGWARRHISRNFRRFRPLQIHP